ncbi:hypothetical protein [Sulfurimonas sp.]|uniref:hypothetical protein n=1 Tax=Sulfurimonas sp. TaxID=2022749 RepID=UPI003565C5F1
MGIKKFISNVIKSLNLENNLASGKKKSLKSLIEKLEKRELEIEKRLKKETNEDIIIQLQEELDIIILYIKKSNKSLDKLKNKNNC